MFKHLLQISDLNRNQIETLISLAESFRLNPPDIKNQENKNKLVGFLFYENSTRTRLSFELAANRCGLQTINLDINTSSVKKDESMIDTIQTLGAMGCQSFVIRHPQSNVFENIIPTLGHQFSFINAGDGQHAHPTQGLLDMLTIYQHTKRFDTLSIGILGDSIHSRVAKSDIVALQSLGCRDIRLIGPQEWLLPGMEGVTRCPNNDSNQAFKGLDVIITLRVQKERMAESHSDTFNHVIQDYIQHYQLTAKRVKQAKPNVIVMHPGPINRGIEIASEVADGSQSAILKQVRNGVLMRTAVWEVIN